MKTLKAAAIVPLCAWLLFACEASTGSGANSTDDSGTTGSIIKTVNKSSTPYAASAPIRKLFASGTAASETVSLSGLANHSVYLVKVNKGGTRVSAANTGSVASYSASGAVGEADALANEERLSAAGEAPSDPPAPSSLEVSGIFTDRDGRTITRHEPPARFHARPAGLPKPTGRADGLLLNETRLAVQYAVNDSRKFWVQDAYSNFTQIDATLRATGKHGNIWAASGEAASGDGKTITWEQAREMATKFDLIYEAETPLFGYEYGGGPVGNGGADGDTMIQILVYDIFDDYYLNQNGGVFGYYYSTDEYAQSVVNTELGDNYKSNEAEIFYIDAHFTDIAPNAIYSTLAHEFQHMINFNVKGWERGLNAEVWYNEMLSMLAEDVIGPFIGVGVGSDSHPVKMRLPYFLGYYTYDPTVWLEGNEVYKSYGNAYALGAYLVRNFGGAALIQQLMQNDAVDIPSITKALSSSANPLNSTVGSFEAALARYGEALLFNQQTSARPAGALSFNNTVTHNIGGTNYTFTGFDLTTIKNERSGKADGPSVWDAATASALPPRTVQLQSKDGWQGKSGSLEITVRRPDSADIDVYIMVR
jgi:hypothetical protein